MATLGRTSWGNNPAAWELAQQLQAQGMATDASLAMVDRIMADNANAQLAIRSAANPGPGQSFDVMIDRSLRSRELSEELPDGTKRLLREWEQANTVRFRASGGPR